MNELTIKLNKIAEMYMIEKDIYTKELLKEEWYDILSMVQLFTYNKKGRIRFVR